MRRTLLAAISAIALVAALVPLGVSSAAPRKPKPTLKFRTVRGREIHVAPLDVSGLDAYNLRCPRGYVATGYGVGLGALDLVYADPSFNGRGYDFAFANSSDADTFSGNAEVRCVTGANAKVQAVSSALPRTSKVALARAARKALHMR